ncbi:hypothetical protein [Sphingobium sp. B12D2B]|uniref:hypothetical protein n=1 Tax=Sphingobium sp. B12D2B TaxID=2940577 RepID=UPI002224690B|nr:hypothetical protein [Sphingobium sp. B12D2B]MCW2351801.1 ribosomal protein L12E/L44/L45/RPP1/RPP2 [Sphingobium sp. B12D2B]
MEFINRLKKEMSEGIVRAVLEDAGYRVTDCGIEKVIPALNCRSVEEYEALSFSTALRTLPDFVVMTSDETEQLLVEVKYRTLWGLEVLEKVREQVRIHGELVLISFNASAPNPRNYADSPSRFLRCCRLRNCEGFYEVELRERGSSRAWHLVDDLTDGPALWWALSPLHQLFGQLREDDGRVSLREAVKAISGILDAAPTSAAANDGADRQPKHRLADPKLAKSRKST